MTERKFIVRSVTLLAIALALGFSIQLADRVLFARALNRPLAFDEPDVFVVNALLSALPLMALAIQKRQRIVLWVLGLVPSVWLSWWWLNKGIAYQRNPDGSGVDISGALIMLVSPFAIAGLCLFLSHRLDHLRGS